MKIFIRNNIDNIIMIFIIIICILSILSYFAYAEEAEYLSVAIKCKTYLSDNKYRYRKGGAKDYPVDITKGTAIDCSGFVSWTVFEYQNGNFEYRQSKWFLSTAKKLFNNEETDSPEFTRGWRAIKGSENFLPGDILCYPGHVHIYYGTDSEQEDHYLVLNAGSSSALKQVVTSISGSYFRRAQYAIRL